MKEIRTIKMVEVEEVKFIAEDGTEFIGENAENKCKEFERVQNEEKVKNEFRKLKPTYLNLPTVNWFSCDSEVILITVKNEIDFDITIKDYFHIKSPRWMDLSVFEDKKPTEYPCELVFISGEEWVDIYSNKEKLKDELQTVLNLF